MGSVGCKFRAENFKELEGIFGVLLEEAWKVIGAQFVVDMKPSVSTPSCSKWCLKFEGEWLNFQPLILGFQLGNSTVLVLTV